MNKRNLIIASVIGVVFLFAGYNLYSYFQSQAEIAIQEEQLAAERQIERERQQAQRDAEREAEEARQAEETRQAGERRDAERAAEQQRQEQARLDAEAQREANQLAAQQDRTDRDAERLAQRIARARTVERIEDFDEAALIRLRSMSPRYLLDNPEAATEVISIPANARVLSTGRRFLRDQSTSFMLLAAATQNTNMLQAALDVGADINAANVEGYTALMFAAAYNSADIVTFLIENGADISAQAYILDLNALHIASLFNPHPDVVQALIEGGFDIESETSTGDSPLIVAALDTPNLEVVQRLVELGANTSAYSSEAGQTPHGIVAGRLAQRDQRIRKISDEYEAEVLGMLEE
jgi:actin-related protein